jgi:Fe-S oxidoreductase
LTALGYEVILVDHEESGRAFISKGFEEAKAIAIQMWYFFRLYADFPLIGIEPSAILTFRDEYIRLADDTESAKKLAKMCLRLKSFQK